MSSIRSQHIVLQIFVQCLSEQNYTRTGLCSQYENGNANKFVLHQNELSCTAWWEQG